MKICFPLSDRAVRPAVVWASAAILTLGVLFGSSSAFATAQANSFIGNQATASYLDSSGASQLATSNLVQTQIQQVGSFTLDSTITQLSPTTVKNTKTGSTGNIVTVSHTVTNTGNGSDSFNIVISNGPNGVTSGMATSVFLDVNNDGVADSLTPVCSAVAGASCTFTTQALGAAGSTTASTSFLIAYTIPQSTTTPTTPYSSGLITVTPATPALYASPNTSASDVDNVNLTLNAAFSANLSLTIPAVSGPGNVAYPAAQQSGKHSSAGTTCAATMTAALAPPTGCVYTTYTLNISNTGGAPGAFYANNLLPAGLTYVASSAVWSGKSGIALGDGVGGDPAGTDFNVTGQDISMRIDQIGSNVNQSVSFMVLVNSSATVGTGLTSLMTTYDSVTSAHATADGSTGATNTNAAPYTVLATAGVVLGSATGTASTSVDSTAGTPLGTAGVAGADQNVVAKITSGGSIKFTHIVFNTGDAADSFNLSAASTFPAGSSITYFATDGTTPLLDTNGDGVIDTGNIAAGGSSTFIIRVQIPSTAPNSGPYVLTVQAKSINDATKLDASGDQATSVSGILVDLTNTSPGTGSGSVGNGDLGAGPSPNPTLTQTTPAGTGSIFTLFINNNDTVTNTYNLDVSQATSFPGSLPAGWTVKYVAAGTTCTASAVSSPISVTAGTILHIDACVTPPLSAPAGSTSVYFRVMSTGTAASTGLVVSDSLQDSLTVTAASSYMSTLSPNNSGQLGAGGTVVYAHTLTNTGAQACGSYNLTATQSGAPAGWTYVIFLDTNSTGQIDPSATPVTTGTGLAVGGAQKYLIRVFAPGGATANQLDTVTFTVTYTDAAATNCGPHSATDISTIVLGSIRAYKTQTLNTACNNVVAPTFSSALITGAKPGQCVTYQIVATNEGTASVTNMKITDGVPSNTTLASIQPTAPCVVSSSVVGTPVIATSATTISCGTATTVPAGSNMTMQFTVQITP